MYKCKICGYQSKKGETAHRKIVSKRSVTYPRGSVGWEIEKDIFPICKNC